MQSYGSHTLGLDFTNSTMKQGVLGTGRGQGNGITFYNGTTPAGRIFDNGAGETEITANTVLDGSLRMTLRTPASSSAPCTEGEIADDANFHYVCVSKNKWRHVALSDY